MGFPEYKGLRRLVQKHALSLANGTKSPSLLMNEMDF